jgi:hypothetical protein
VLTNLVAAQLTGKQPRVLAGLTTELIDVTGFLFVDRTVATVVTSRRIERARFRIAKKFAIEVIEVSAVGSAQIGPVALFIPVL